MLPGLIVGLVLLAAIAAWTSYLEKRLPNGSMRWPELPEDRRRRAVLAFGLVGFTGVFALGAATQFMAREQYDAAVVAAAVATMALVGSAAIAQAMVASMRR